ncbi:putative G-protein coupled receptor Mth-like 1 [Phthorimaea operculella]|nr:putative G-protein coupled receptor Mth-like 1 [Phthorimaea operculella]
MESCKRVAPASAAYIACSQPSERGAEARGALPQQRDETGGGRDVNSRAGSRVSSPPSPVAASQQSVVCERYRQGEVASIAATKLSHVFIRRTYLKKVPGHWRLVAATLPACAELRVLPEHSAPYALLANNATLVMRGAVPQSLPPDRYCGDASAALVCNEDSTTSTAVAKCCTKGQVFDNKKCIDDEKAAHETLAALISLANASGLTVGHGWPVCAAGPSWAVAGMLADGRLRDDGALELGSEVLSAGAWCAEGAPDAGAARVLACEADARTAKPKQPLRHALYGAGLAVGAAFLAATLAAGFALPAAHHALHWRCQTHYVACLMLGDALLAGTQLAGDAVPPTLCRVLAVCMHFLFLSAFFWLNTMCFNIWWTFRDFRPTSLERGQEAWRLRERCWFGGDVEILVYFFGPVGVLLLVNLALFISTARQLTCGLWRRDEVKSTSERLVLSLSLIGFI